MNTFLIVTIILLAIILVLMWFIGVLIKALNDLNIHNGKYKRNFYILYEWLNKKRSNANFILNELEKNEISSVAIYGYHYLGLQLYKELLQSDIEVKCFIDRRKVHVNSGVPIITENNLPDVDAVIVTAISDFLVIKERLVGKCKMVVSLEDLI